MSQLANSKITWWTNISVPECKSRISCTCFRITELLHFRVLKKWISLAINTAFMPASIARKIYNVYHGIIEYTIHKLRSIRGPPESTIVFKHILFSYPVRYAIEYERFYTSVSQLNVFSLN